MKYIRIIWIVCCGFLIIALWLDILNFIEDPSKYYFVEREVSRGNETYSNYIVESIKIASWFSLGCILGCIKRAKIFLIGHILGSLIYMGHSLYTFYQMIEVKEVGLKSFLFIGLDLVMDLFPIYFTTQSFKSINHLAPCTNRFI